MNTNNIEEIDILNPLDEPVNEKRYSQPNINTTGIDLNQPIEEPAFTPPPFQKKESTTTTSSSSSEKKVKPEPINPEMKNLSKKDTDEAADRAVDIFLTGYELLHVFGNKMLQVSEKKLNKLQAEGEINLDAMIDYDYGKKIRAGEFFEQYNEQVKDVLSVSQEFKDELRPPLRKVLAKKGIGVSDETNVGFIVLKDMAAKIVIFAQQKMVVKNMIESIKEATMVQAQQMEQQRQYEYQERARAQQQFEAQRQREEEERRAREEEEKIQQQKERGIVKKEQDKYAVEPEEYIVDAKKRRGRPTKYQ